MSCFGRRWGPCWPGPGSTRRGCSGCALVLAAVAPVGRRQCGRRGRGACFATISARRCRPSGRPSALRRLLAPQCPDARARRAARARWETAIFADPDGGSRSPACSTGNGARSATPPSDDPRIVLSRCCFRAAPPLGALADRSARIKSSAISARARRSRAPLWRADRCRQRSRYRRPFVSEWPGANTGCAHRRRRRGCDERPAARRSMPVSSSRPTARRGHADLRQRPLSRVRPPVGRAAIPAAQLAAHGLAGDRADLALSRPAGDAGLLWRRAVLRRWRRPSSLDLIAGQAVETALLVAWAAAGSAARWRWLASP